MDLFSSPHGDFSFSIKIERRETIPTITFSSPHGDFSFSMIDNRMIVNSNGTVFVPSRGFLFFYAYLKVQPGDIMEFSSPHGDFSFSIKEMTLDTMLTLFSSPHGDFSFSIISLYIAFSPVYGFRPLTGISLFLLRRYDSYRR